MYIFFSTILVHKYIVTYYIFLKLRPVYKIATTVEMVWKNDKCISSYAVYCHIAHLRSAY